MSGRRAWRPAPQGAGVHREGAELVGSPGTGGWPGRTWGRGNLTPLLGMALCGEQRRAAQNMAGTPRQPRGHHITAVVAVDASHAPVRLGPGDQPGSMVAPLPSMTVGQHTWEELRERLSGPGSSRPGEPFVSGVRDRFQPDLTSCSLHSLPPCPCPWGWELR